MFKRPLVPVFACFAGGILIGRFFLLFNNQLFLFTLFVLLLLFFIICPEKIKSYILPVLFLAAGMFLVAPRGNPIDLIEVTAGKKVIIEGTVLTPPRVNDRIIRFELKTEKVFIDNKILDTYGKFNSILEGHPSIKIPGIEMFYHLTHTQTFQQQQSQPMERFTRV